MAKFKKGDLIREKFNGSTHIIEDVFEGSSKIARMNEKWRRFTGEDMPQSAVGEYKKEPVWYFFGYGKWVLPESEVLPVDAARNSLPSHPIPYRRRDGVMDFKQLKKGMTVERGGKQYKVTGVFADAITISPGSGSDYTIPRNEWYLYEAVNSNPTTNLVVQNALAATRKD